MRPERRRTTPYPEVSPPEPTNPWRLAVYCAVVGLTASGVAWLAARYFLATDNEFGRVMPSWAARVLAIHGGLAMLSLVAIGAWLPLHVVPRLPRPRGLITGITQLACLCVLTATGYGLYYLADEISRPVWSVTHWVPGLILPGLLLIHRGARIAGHE